MKAFRLLLSALILAAAVLFLWRLQTFRELKAEQHRLQEQVETNSPAVSAPAPVEPVATEALTAAERSELLRLRGEAGSLRRELTQATNELARLARSPRPTSRAPSQDSTLADEKSQAIERMTRGKQGMVALILYAEDHAGRMPGTLPEAAPYLGTQPGITDDFEFTQPGMVLATNRSPSTTIVLRQKEPVLLSNGRWSRAYAFADGHVENAVQESNDFTAWEEKHRPVENPVPQ